MGGRNRLTRGSRGRASPCSALVKFDSMRRAGPAGPIDGEPRQQLLEHHPHLQLGQVRAQAEVRPAARRTRRGGWACGVMSKPSGSANWRSSWLAETQPHHHLVAGRDAGAAQLDVAGGGAPEVHHRRRPAQDLLDRRSRISAGSSRNRCHRVGVLHQGAHPVRDRLARGLVARHHQQQEHGVELALGQPPAVLVLPGDQLRDQVVARLQRGARRRAGGRTRRPPSRPGCGTGTAGTRSLSGLAGCRPPQCRDRCCRSCGRPSSISSPSSAAARRGSGTAPGSAAPLRSPRRSRTRPGQRAVEDLARQLAEQLLVGGDRPRREALVDDRAQAASARGGSVSSIDLRASSWSGSRSSSAVAPVSDENVAPVLEHRDHVVVAGDAPEPLAVLPVVPVHRRLAAQQLERLVGDALGEGVVVELDVGQRARAHRVAPSRIWSVFRSE